MSASDTVRVNWNRTTPEIQSLLADLADAEISAEEHLQIMIESETR